MGFWARPLGWCAVVLAGLLLAGCPSNPYAPPADGGSADGGQPPPDGSVLPLRLRGGFVVVPGRTSIEPYGGQASQDGGVLLPGIKRGPSH